MGIPFYTQDWNWYLPNSCHLQDPCNLPNGQCKWSIRMVWCPMYRRWESLSSSCQPQLHELMMMMMMMIVINSLLDRRGRPRNITRMDRNRYHWERLLHWPRYWTEGTTGTIKTIGKITDRFRFRFGLRKWGGCLLWRVSRVSWKWVVAEKRRVSKYGRERAPEGW